MDEYVNLVALTVPEKVGTSSNLPHEPEKPKRYSLKSARTALKRMQADLEKKMEQIAALKKEIAVLKSEIRTMTALVEQLERAEAEKKMQDAFRMKSKHMTGNQVMKALNLVQQLDGDLDSIDIDELTTIIRAATEKKKRSNIRNGGS